MVVKEEKEIKRGLQRGGKGGRWGWRRRPKERY